MLRSICRLLLLALLPALSILPAAGHALTVRCVADTPALAGAFNDALASNDSIFMIKLRPGQYELAAALPYLNLSRANQIVEISGGWTGANGACTDHLYGYDNTMLAGEASGKTLHFNVSGNGTMLYIHDISIANPGNVVGNGACMLGWVAAGSSLSIERTRFTHCHAGVDGSSASGELSNAGAATLRDIFIEHGRAEYNGGMAIYTTGNGVTQLAHLSVTGTHATAADAIVSGLALINTQNGRTELGNSVIWGNDPDKADLYLGGPFHWLTRVHTGTRGGDAPAGDNMSGSGDPGFVSPDNPRLRADSVLVDSGVSNPAGGSGSYDVDGHPRVAGAAVDVGAFESDPASDTIFADDFD